MLKGTDLAYVIWGDSFGDNANNIKPTITMIVEKSRMIWYLLLIFRIILLMVVPTNPMQVVIFIDF